MVLWSLNFAAVKYILDHGFEPLAYAAIRFGLAACVFSVLTYGHEGSLAVRRRDLWLVVGVAGIGLWANQISFVYALELTESAATVALLFGTLPIFVGLVASAFRVERLHARQWAATGVSFAGVALVAVGSGGEINGALAGPLVALAATATWAAYSVSIGPLMRIYSPYRINAVALLATAIPLGASAIPQILKQDWGEVTPGAWGAALYATFLALVVTNLLWFTAISRVGAARSSLYANLQPFLGALFAVLLLSEDLSVADLVGGALIGGAIILARRSTPQVGQLE